MADEWTFLLLALLLDWPRVCRRPPLPPSLASLIPTPPPTRSNDNLFAHSLTRIRRIGRELTLRVLLIILD